MLKFENFKGVEGKFNQGDVNEVLNGLMSYMLGEIRRDVINNGVYLSTLAKFEEISFDRMVLGEDQSTFIVNYVLNTVHMVHILGEDEEVSLLNILMDELYDVFKSQEREYELALV